MIPILLWSLLFQAAGASPSAPPTVAYDIAVTLNPETHVLDGNLTLTYTNTSPDVLDELQFHAYLNASLNNASTYNREGLFTVDNGYLRITSCRRGGEDALGQLHFLQKEDASPNDRTVFALPLPQPLFPGEATVVQFGFEAKIPRAWDRVGYNDTFHMIAQWFPKVGVWETTGFRGVTVPGWNCHANHSITEYFANFGTYRVAITVPSNYVVGATGEALGQPVVSGEQTTYTFYQEQVHDFAWTAWPKFVREVRRYEPPDDEAVRQERARLAQLFGCTPAELTPQPVEMILLLAPEHTHLADRHFNALSAALTQYAMWFKPYPYKTVTMVDPPSTPPFAGGMEYPTLFTVGAFFHDPTGGLEELLIHEFTHQYFYGLVATNEAEESWMDEGFTTYVTNKLMQKLYGNLPDNKTFSPLFSGELRALRKVKRSFPTHFGLEPLSFPMQSRLEALTTATPDPLTLPAWKYKDYVDSSYAKPATVLAQLEREIGTDMMARVLRRYVNVWAFRHPTAEDFKTVVTETVGRDMAWFFTPMLEKPIDLDFYVGESFREELSSEGLSDDALEPMVLGEPKPEAKRRTVVTLRKKGSTVYPVDVRITFEDGRQILERWTGETAIQVYRYEGAIWVKSIEIDPERKVLFDNNHLNNDYTFQPDPRAQERIQARWTVMAQHLLHFIAGGL